MTRVVAISDTHGTHLEFKMPPGDILIHAGDGTNGGEPDEIVRLNNWFKKLKADGVYKDIVYVPGNHDFLFQEDTGYALELMPDATVLMDKAIEIHGVKIYGSPWVPVFGIWAFMQPDLNLTKYWEQIPENLDILVTHGPPYGILDQTVRLALAGSQTLMREVLRKRPRFHIFGHIHEEGQKTYRINPTTFVNAAMMVSWYDEREKNPMVLEV